MNYCPAEDVKEGHCLLWYFCHLPPRGLIMRPHHFSSVSGALYVTMRNYLVQIHIFYCHHHQHHHQHTIIIIVNIIVIKIPITCFLAATILFWPLPASTVATAVAIFPVHHCHHHHHHHYYYDCKCDDCDDDVVVNVPGLDYCCEKSEMLVPRIKVQSADCPLCLADPILSSPDMLLSDQEMEVTCASLHVITMITLSSSP